MTSRRPKVLMRLRASFVGVCFTILLVSLRPVVAQDPFGAAYGVASGGSVLGYSSAPTPPPTGTAGDPAAVINPSGGSAASSSGSSSSNPSAVSKFGASGRSRAKSNLASPDWRHWWSNNSETWVKSRARIRDVSAHRREGAGTEALSAFDPIGPSRARREILPLLQKALSADEPAMRAAAVVACGRVGGPTDHVLRIEMTRLLSDPLLDVQASALLGLGLQGHGESIPLLSSIAADSGLGRELLNQRDGIPVQLRSIACTSLGLVVQRTNSPLRSGVAGLLMRVAQSDAPSTDLRGSAILAAGIVGDASILPQLTALVRSESADRAIRAHAATVLAKLGNASAVPVLLELLGSGSALLAPAAASGLGIACRAGDESALKQLVSATTSADRALLSASIAALGEIGSAKSLAALEALVQSGENFSSAQAAISLALALGTTANGKQQALLLNAHQACANQEDRSAYSLALALIHHPEALSQIEHVLRKKNPDRESAWHYLTAAGVLGDHRLVEHILPWVRQSKDPALRQKAAVACAMLHGESLVQDLLESLEDSMANQSALFATLGALATTGDGRTIPALTRLVDRSAGLPELSRAAVIASLGMLADKDSEPMLQRWRHGVQTAAAGAVVRSLLRVN